MSRAKYKLFAQQPVNLTPIHPSIHHSTHHSTHPSILYKPTNKSTNPYDKNVWGPDLWNILHVFSYNYPDIPSNIERIHAKNFLTSLAFLIPCSDCKEHYTMHLHKNHPDINSREMFIKWVLTLHNKVNERHSKEKWSRNKLDDKYETDNKYCA